MEVFTYLSAPLLKLHKRQKDILSDMEENAEASLSSSNLILIMVGLLIGDVYLEEE